MRTHRMRKTRFYIIWRGILARCNDKNSINYPRYGGRGIKCLWKSFEEFRDDMFQAYQEHAKRFGEKDTSIERIDNCSHYSKDNCIFTTARMQARNRRSNILLTYNGKTQCVADWAIETGWGWKTLYWRVKYNWPDEKILTIKPVIGHNQFTKSNT